MIKLQRTSIAAHQPAHRLRICGQMELPSSEETAPAHEIEPGELMHRPSAAAPSTLQEARYRIKRSNAAVCRMNMNEVGQDGVRRLGAGLVDPPSDLYGNEDEMVRKMPREHGSGHRCRSVEKHSQRKV